ncbi:MAG: hypothetical protein U0359_41740 [Byssovorax sp.]
MLVGDLFPEGIEEGEGLVRGAVLELRGDDLGPEGCVLRALLGAPVVVEALVELVRRGVAARGPARLACLRVGGLRERDAAGARREGLAGGERRADEAGRELSPRGADLSIRGALRREVDPGAGRDHGGDHAAGDGRLDLALALRLLREEDNVIGRLLGSLELFLERVDLGSERFPVVSVRHGDLGGA